MEKKVLMWEVALRFCCLLSALAAAFLVGMDTEKKEIIYTVEKKATYKDVKALGVFVTVEAIVAGYNLLQLCKCMVCNSRREGSTKGALLCLYWATFFFDQTVAYASLSMTAAVTQVSALAINGASPFQWQKLCDRFTRFCVQIGGGILCALAATTFMAVVAAISAFYLFRLHTSKRFLALKTSFVSNANNHVK